MPFPHLENFNMQQWMKENSGDWGSHKVRRIWENSDFIAIVSRGPWERTEFHINPGDEIFQQLEGELDFHYLTPDGERKRILLRAGELFLLPAGVPHSPRRPDPNSWSYVVERKRRPGDMDRFVWFCEKCNNKLYEVDSPTSAGPRDKPNSALADGLERLKADEALRTCKSCGEVLPVYD